ncbi:MAG: polysaccharide biosynthesis/export protein [Acidobacteriota bacterium]|jgi:polysaccharide export outer membrane protein|nr:polysaccharide biosynthesis/export protein [Acidobacteriota bacterium]
MKTLKAFFALVLICSTVALPLRAQQKSSDKQPPPQKQSATPPPVVESMPVATPVSTIALKESVTYTEKRDYLLGPSDLLELKVFNDPQFNSDLEVDPDGNIVVPFVDQPIRAQCRNVNAVRKDVTTALSRFLKEPRVYMRIKEQNSHKPVLVYGAVRTFTKSDMRRPVRLLELISNSGGVTEQQSGTIQIMHTEPPQCPDIEPVEAAPVETASDALGLPFALYKVDDLRQGKPEANPYLRPGDIVYVAEASPIYVVGNVAQPANLYLREGTTLTRVLAQVGGAKDANEEKVRIYRKKPNAPQEVLTVNYKAIKQGKEPDPVLQPYDIIEVPKAGQFRPEKIAQMLVGIGMQSATSIGTMAPMRIIY